MATNFPTSLDTLTNPTSSDSLNSPSHSAQHADANDAIEALQAKVGIDSSAVTSSLEYRIAQLEAAGSGLTLITSSSFSGSSAASVDNCFTSDYSAYQIVLFISSSSTTGNLYMRFRSSGTDTASNYGIGEALIRHTDGYFAADGNNSSSTVMLLGYISTARVQHTISVWEPYETQRTGMWYNAAHGSYVEWGGAMQKDSLSFDGFTVYPSTGTFSGNVYVYGMATS